jgi:hypothetical protein
VGAAEVQPLEAPLPVPPLEAPPPVPELPPLPADAGGVPHAPCEHVASNEHVPVLDRQLPVRWPKDWRVPLHCAPCTKKDAAPDGPTVPLAVEPSLQLPWMLHPFCVNVQLDGGQLPDRAQDPEISGQVVGPPPSPPQPEPNGAASSATVKIRPKDFMRDV